jgi:hypothetical protein
MMLVRRPVPAAFAAIALLGLVCALAPLDSGTASTSSARLAEQDVAARNIEVNVNKKTVVKGKKVKLTGAVIAPTDAACAAGQLLDIQRSTKGASYPSVGTVTTDAAGAFKFSIKVTKKARFRVSVDASATCSAAQSPPRTVDVTKPAS